jgi:hypothetical protein
MGRQSSAKFSVRRASIGIAVAVGALVAGIALAPASGAGGDGSSLSADEHSIAVSRAREQPGHEQRDRHRQLRRGGGGVLEHGGHHDGDSDVLGRRARVRR